MGKGSGGSAPGEAGATSAATSAAEPAVQPVLTTPEVTDDLLFVAKATSGTLALDDDGNGSLTMTSVPMMTWFSDRPDHDAGTAATLDALKAFGWKKNDDNLGKGDMAPNAALTGDGMTETVVVELLDVARDGDDLTFAVTAVNKVPAKQRRVTLGRSELFIDSVQPLAEGPVVGKIRGGVFVGQPGTTVVEGDVVQTADGKQAVNLTVRPFFRDGRYANEKMMFTLTEDNPYISRNEQAFPFVTVVIGGMLFMPADPAAGRSAPLVRVYSASGAGYNDVGTIRVIACRGDVPRC